MDERFNELLRRVYGILKPMGYRKAKQLRIPKQTNLLSWQIIFAGIDLRLSMCEEDT